MGIKKCIGKIRELTKKIKINKLNTKKCNINERKSSAYTPVPFLFPAVSKANKRSLSQEGLGSPFTTSLYKTSCR